jgi:hypothetical protein
MGWSPSADIVRCGPEALSTNATVESVAVRGCRAKPTLELYYPGRAVPALRLVVGKAI